MKVNENLTMLIMLLLLIVLLLTIAILGVILWSLVVCLRPIVSDIRNHTVCEHTSAKGKIWAKEDENDLKENASEKSSSLIIEDIEPPYQYDEQGQYRREKSIKNWNQYDEIEQPKEWQSSGEIEKDWLQEENIKIKLTLINLKEVSNYQGNALFAESEDGEIVVYKKSGEEYYANPSKDIISERSYAYTGLKSCFDVTSIIESNVSYSVRVIASCILIWDGNYYIVKRKGNLQIYKEN